jgi:type VI secretion system ImpC/EvpB family protein
VDGFRFREEVTGPDRSKYLWGGAAYALGGSMIRAFASTGWLADIHGVHRDVDGGGLVTDLPVHCFTTDRLGIAPRSSTDVIITDELEKRLSELGFVSLCDCHDTEYSAFYSTPSLQEPKKYDRQLSTTNARISAMLHSMLCASRFAHYLKVISRDRIGGSTDPKELQRFLQQWVAEYVTADSDASPNVRARFPLREASVQVTAARGQAGVFEAVMHLLPHYEIEGISTGIRLVAKLQGVRNE